MLTLAKSRLLLKSAWQSSSTNAPRLDSDEESEEDGPVPTDQVAGSSIAVSGMGAVTQADHYDEDSIFRFLVFYLDTIDNARKNGLLSDAGQVDIKANDRT